MTRKLVFVVFQNFQLLDAAGPIGAFEMANRFSSGAYRLVLVSLRGGLVESSAGASLVTSRFADVDDVDTLIAVGGEGVIDASDCPETMAFRYNSSIGVRPHSNTVFPVRPWRRTALDQPSPN